MEDKLKIVRENSYLEINRQPWGHKNPFAGRVRKQKRDKKKTQRLARRRQR